MNGLDEINPRIKFTILLPTSFMIVAALSSRERQIKGPKNSGSYPGGWITASGYFFRVQNPHLEAGRLARLLLCELLRELRDDAVAEHVSHHEYVVMHRVESRDIRRPVTAQAGHRFGKGGIKVHFHQILHFS